MDEIHVHKTKKSICAHFAESPCMISLFQKEHINNFVLICIVKTNVSSCLC